MELPFAARYVEDPPDLDARRLPSRPVLALLDRAQELLEASAVEVADIRAFVEALRIDPYGRVPRRPPSRSDSANPSQKLCKSRSKSAK